MFRLRRLIRPKSRVRRDCCGQSALMVRVDLLGRRGEVAFLPGSHDKRIYSNSMSVLVDVGPDDKVYFTYPPVHGFKRAPAEGALPLKGGAQYFFSGSVELLGGSQVSAVLVYFDADSRLGHESTLLTTGSFVIEVRLPATAQKAVLGFRIKGPACFAVHNLLLTGAPRVDPTVEVADEAKPGALEMAEVERDEAKPGALEMAEAERDKAEMDKAATHAAELDEANIVEAETDEAGTIEAKTGQAKTVVMIVLNDIVHDGRVLKAAQTLMNNGYRVTLLGMGRTQHSTLKAVRIAGARALIFPNPSSLLRNARSRALNWEHTVAYLRATMWHYVKEASPRFIHTHDYHAVPLGFEFTRRLRELGHGVHWLHDFHEYVPGYDHMEADWQDAILAHEDRAMRAMDHRFTVSPLIATWLEERYGLAEAPTVVLNTPSREALSVEFERTVRRDLALAGDVDLIVYTGGVSELRGVHTVVEALAADPGWHFAVVTNNVGPYIARLERIAAEGGYGDRLHFLPYVQPHEVTAYVRDASIGIMPFRRYGNTDASLPNKLYDYLHAGLPMAASNCTLIQQFLETWQVGEVFKEEDVRDCAETIARVLAHQVLYRANIRARPELLRECTWEEQAKKILDAYGVLEGDAQAVPEASPPKADTAGGIGRERGSEFYDGRMQRVKLSLEQSHRSICVATRSPADLGRCNQTAVRGQPEGKLEGGADVQLEP
jgi:glycosyltransferase involved in cell wall biosynthesis